MEHMWFVAVLLLPFAGVLFSDIFVAGDNHECRKTLPAIFTEGDSNEEGGCPADREGGIEILRNEVSMLLKSVHDCLLPRPS